MTTSQLGGLHLTFIEGVMAQHAYPPKSACDSAGVVACYYLTWRGQLPAALIALFWSSTIGSVLYGRT